MYFKRNLHLRMLYFEGVLGFCFDKIKVLETKFNQNTNIREIIWFKSGKNKFVNTSNINFNPLVKKPFLVYIDECRILRI